MRTCWNVLFCEEGGNLTFVVRPLLLIIYNVCGYWRWVRYEKFRGGILKIGKWKFWMHCRDCLMGPQFGKLVGDRQYFTDERSKVWTFHMYV